LRPIQAATSSRVYGRGVEAHRLAVAEDGGEIVEIADPERPKQQSGGFEQRATRRA
jgi:hypothetical protein